MTIFEQSVIHLGNIAYLDPLDGNRTAENQNALLGTYFSAADPASGHIAQIKATDGNDDGLIDSNDRPDPEDIVFNIGGGPVETSYDSLFNVNVTVTFPPDTGQPDYNGLSGIIQTETGDLFFVMIDDGEGFGSNPFDDFPIETIQINSISAFGSQALPSASDTQSFVPCFAAGTLIRTDKGLVAVEALRLGDRVVTLDNGLQPVRWIGQRSMSMEQLICRVKVRPIRIRAGALGPAFPAQDMVVSPQHRVLLASKIATRVMGTPEILVAATKMVGLPGIERTNPGRAGVKYHHFACDAHEVVWANGAPTETFLVGPEFEKSFRSSGGSPLDAFAPDRVLARAGPRNPARQIVERGAKLRQMFQRHSRNSKPLVIL